jgi:hypothetical protein
MWRTLAVVVFTAACSGEMPTLPHNQLSIEPTEVSAESGLAAQRGAGISARDQAAIDAFHAERTTGASFLRDVCGLGIGFFDGDDFLGFGGLFPSECPGGFIRTNPDGSEDQHLQGRGSLFLFLFEYGIFPSDGSDVGWQATIHEDGIVSASVHGTLSDGSRVRIHFTDQPTGRNNSADSQLWIEGVGYVRGFRPGRR